MLLSSHSLYNSLKYALLAEMVQVKESETVADLNNDYFLLCRSEHLAKTRSDESPPPEITSAVPFSSSVIVDTRPDLLVVSGASSSNQTSLRPQSNVRVSSFDCAPSSPSSRLSVTPTLYHSQSHGCRLSIPSMSSSSLDQVSPSSKILSSAEVGH